MFFNQPEVNYTANKGRQNVGSINRHNFSRRVSGQKIDIIKREELCKKCNHDKFISYFANNKFKCTKCKTIIFKK